MPYQTIIFKEYSKLGYSVNAFYLDKKSQTPYKPDEILNVLYLPKSNFSKKTLLNKVINLNPNILLVCGWVDSDYLYVARWFKKNTKIPIVCPIDTQFNNRIKQIIGFVISPFYVKSAFTHIWIPGFRQYEFARLLGYSRTNILFNSLSGDVQLFDNVTIEPKKKDYPKRFLYVGRFNKVKGLDVLISAWKNIENKNGWIFTLVGNGQEKDILLNVEGFEVFDFMSQEELVILAQNSGCFVLPSKYEPWALVIHEFAASGLPIICSDVCGASDTFVENGYNGFKFKSGDYLDLKNKLNYIISCDKDELIKLSENSKKLSKRITPEISAASFLSLLNKQI